MVQKIIEVITRVRRKSSASRTRKDLRELRGTITFADDYDYKATREHKNF